MSPAKTDYPIQIGDKQYLFRFNWKATNTIENLTGKPLGKVLNDSDEATWGIVFFAGLQKNHPEVTLESIGDVIDEADNYFELKKAVQVALVESLGLKKTAKKNETTSPTTTVA